HQGSIGVGGRDLILYNPPGHGLPEQRRQGFFRILLHRTQIPLLARAIGQPQGKGLLTAPFLDNLESPFFFLQLEYPHFNGRGPYPAIILSKKEPVRPAHLIVLRSDGNRHTVGERYCLNGWLRRYGRLWNRRHALGIYLPGFAIFGDFVKNDLLSSVLQHTDFRESPGG